MKKIGTLAGSVVRAHVAGLLLSAVAILIVGGAAAGVVALRRDDVSAVALAKTLGTELEEHAADSREAIGDVIREELDEGRWFQRRIEVWRGGDRLGGDARDAMFGDYRDAPEDCTSTTTSDGWTRVCVVHAPPGTTLVVGSPIRPIVLALAPVLAAIALAAIATALLSAAVGARIVRRRLAPLSSFEATIGSLPAVGPERRVDTTWGASEIDALATTFNGLLRRIDQAIEREHRFVADAAHELRTPLTRLRAQIELAIEEARDAEGSPERLTTAARTCEELGRMIESLLALARDQIADDGAVNLADVARAERDGFAGEMASRIEVAGDDEVLVRGDERLLALAVRNVLDNALKYSSDAVSVTVSSDGGAPRIVVEDAGSGVASEDIERIRDPFVRGSGQPKRVGGSGLGLALVEHVTRLHGGGLEIKNRAPRGLEVVLRFAPWTPADLPAAPR